MNTEILEEIGLTKSEISVYLALLELGSSSTGKIVDKSKASSSKIYEILDKLMQKGLVSFIIKSGVRYFEAAPPERIMDYMKEKEEKFTQQKNALKTVLPELELKQKLSKYKSEATIYKGIKGGETAFRKLINSMKKTDEWIGFVVYFENERYFNLLTKLHEWRASKGLKSRIIFHEDYRHQGEHREKLPHTQIKYMPDELKIPAVVNVAGNIVLLNVMSEDPVVFMIENKELADSFRSQFEKLWNQKMQSFQGQDAVEAAYESILEKARPTDDVVIFAAKPKTKGGADYNLKWNEEIRKKAKSVRLLYYGNTQENRSRAEEMEKTGCPAKIILTQQTLPISTVVAGDIALNTVWGENPISFKIENKTVADSLKGNFELLWNQQAFVIKGVDAIQGVFEDMLQYEGVDFIGARGYFIDVRPKYIDEWEKRARKKGFRIRNLVDPEVKGHRITKFPFAETKYTLSREFASLSCFWIYGNKVVITNWVEKEPLVFVIENKHLHDMYKKQFEVLWNKKI